MSKVKIGDVVQLNSGYIDMTVIEVGVVTKKVVTSSGAKKTVNDVVVSCVWQDPSHGKLNKGTFPLQALRCMTKDEEPVKKELVESTETAPVVEGGAK